MNSPLGVRWVVKMKGRVPPARSMFLGTVESMGWLTTRYVALGAHERLDCSVFFCSLAVPWLFADVNYVGCAPTLRGFCFRSLLE